jgi:osmotically-inducible protein OsmY
MKATKTFQKPFQDVIKQEPLSSAFPVAAITNDILVKLHLNVNRYIKKTEAHTTTKFEGEEDKADANFEDSFLKNDTRITNEILNAWRWDWNVPKKKLKIKVENAWVTLEGEVEWNFEKEAAKKSVEKLLGVSGVTNNITLKSNCKYEVKGSLIERALKRSWSLNDKNVSVLVNCNNVKLSGTVNSLYQKEEAARLAWNTPGVWSVDNNLSVLFN